MERCSVSRPDRLEDVSFVLPDSRYQVSDSEQDFSCREPAPVYFWPNLYYLFSEQAKKNPYHLAVQDNHDQHSYADLDRRATQIAEDLSRSGVEREDAVGVCIAQSAELIAAILAVLKLGAALVLFDSRSSLARQQCFMQDSSAKVFLGDSSSVANFKNYSDDLSLDYDYRFIVVDRISRLNEPTVSYRPVLNNRLAQLSYRYDAANGPSTLFYEHQAFLDVIGELKLRLPVTEFRSMLSTCSVYRPRFLVELFFALTSGLTFNFISESEAANSFSLNAAIKRTGADILFAPNNVFIELANSELTISSKLAVVSVCHSDSQAVPAELEKHTGGVWYYFDRSGKALCSSIKQSDDNSYIGDVESNSSEHAGDMGLPRLEKFKDLVSQAKLTIASPTIDKLVSADGVRFAFGEVEYFLKQHPAVALARVEEHEGRVKVYVTLSESFGVHLDTDLEVFAKNKLTGSNYTDIQPASVTACLALSARLNNYLSNNLVVSFHPDCYIYTC